MLEQPWRRLVLIVLLLGLGAGALATYGLRLGLDLQGGSRLVYRVDLEQAKRDKIIPENADDTQVMQETLGILAQRIDPQGILEASITQAGSDRILIELPGRLQANIDEIKARIEQLGSLEMIMVAYPDYEGYPDKPLNEKPFEDLEEEKNRLRTWLASDENKALVAKNPLDAIRKFNQNKESGPQSQHLIWAPMYRERTQAWEDASEEQKKDPEFQAQQWQYERHSLAVQNFMPLNTHEMRFRGEDLVSGALRETQDGTGRPALGYEIKPEKVAAYGEWSERNLKKCSAILLNGEVRLAPVFESPIKGGQGIIRGIGTSAEVNELIKVLKTGSLEIIPQLDSETTVGASLGEIAIEQGEFSIILGALLILVFMLGYYKMAGLIAIIGLLMNVGFVFGILSFVRATLTLPGLAGIVLTVGMAVDANILIFERIREELFDGKDLKHAVEAGFEKAMSTILDANITTFLTGVWLYVIGIGPIRGFAVTLMIGIVTSVFTALYCSRLLFHFLLARGATELNMRQLFKRPSFRFLTLRKITTVLSIVMVSSGLYVFFSTTAGTKYGLDFTGGAAVTVALDEKMEQKDLLDLLQKDARFKEQFGDPQVTTLGETNREFSIKIKLDAKRRDTLQASQDKAHEEKRAWTPPFIRELRRLLGDKLANDPFSVLSQPTDIGSGTIVEVALNSKTPVQVADVRKALSAYQVAKCEGYEEGTGEHSPEVAVAKRVYVNLTMEPLGGKTPEETKEAEDEFRRRLPGILRARLAGLKSAENPDEVVTLSSPFPETSLIGSRAVGDLQNAAIGAILVSILTILLYIRVRFREFKYGIGACVALVHDVSIVLGLVVLGNAIGIVHAEINLSMIAAFLTIIGYSLNDTIVVFDRIRENLELKRKYKEEIHFEELIDTSVNQTLSRTVLTSVTTFLVILSILVFNHGAGSVLEGFSFAMLCGIIVGTYSSIFVANPVVLWLTNRELKQGKDYYEEGEQLEGNVQEGIV